MHQQKGNILLITLIISSLILLITAASVEMTILHFKMQQSDEEAFIAFKNAELAAKNIQDTLDMLSIKPQAESACVQTNCIHTLNKHMNFLTEPHSWWEQHANPIHFKNAIIAYDYIEEYDEIIQGSQTIVYYRISILGLTKDEIAQSLIQINLRKIFTNTSTQAASRVAWRYLDKLNT